MPELPEVETIRRDLEGRLTGLKALGVPHAAPAMLRGLPAARLRGAVTGRRFLAPLRHGKLLRFPLEGGAVVEVHLGMSGRLTLEPLDAPKEPHTHVEIELEGGRALRFRDPRRFGRWALVEGGVRLGQVFAHGGVDPLDAAFTPEALRAVLTASRAEVKRLLLDQDRVAGLGNIYVCEALFNAAVGPFRRGASLTASECARLHAEIVAVLDMALAYRGTTLLDYRDASGELGGFQRLLKVYDREGEPCPRCGAKVLRKVQAGRSTFYCGKCQKRGAGR